MRTSFLITALVTLILPLTAAASRITLTAPGTVRPGDTLVATVTLDTEGKAVNAVEGIVTYPRELLTIREVRDGNSIVSLWVEKPEDTGAGVSFAGVIPGAYTGADGLLLTLVFTVSGEGEGTLSAHEVQALLNDGQGTADQVRVSSVTVRTAMDAEAGLVLPDDIDPPEEFDIQVSRSPDLFDGAWFAVYATQDKGSGVKGYRLCEGLWGGCREAESPTELAHIDRLIRVTATDHAGNRRTETLFTPEAKKRYTGLAVVPILVIVLVILYAYRRTLWRRFASFSS